MLIVAALLLVVPFISLADVLVNAKIDSVTSAIDKNGNSYVRFIVIETKSLQGIEYTDGTAVMAFGSMVKAVKNLKDGDTLKAICSEREYKGRKSYTILKLLPSK
jgi:hypothetical protein